MSKRTRSSSRWLAEHESDPYVRQAREQGWRSRAVFKLEEIQRGDRLIRPGMTIVDLGAAPGGWSQVAADRTKSADGKGQVVAIDLLDMEQIAGVEFIQLDFMHDTAPGKLKAMLRDGGADIVLSDMAAQGTGHARTDHLRIMGLAEAAIEFACEVLTPGGAFVCKVFQGGTERELLDRLKRNFAKA